MKHVDVVVPGLPQPKRRVRFGRTRRGRPTTYTDARTVEWEEKCAHACNAYSGRKPLDGAVGIEVTAVYPRNKRRPRWCPAALWKLGTRVRKVTKPDVDNLVKACLDGVQMSRVLRDDAAVAVLHAEKFVGEEGEDPHVALSIWELELHAEP